MSSSRWQSHEAERAGLLCTISYAVNGKQYIAVTTGKGGGSPWLVPNTVTPEINPPNEGFALYVFALPDKK